MFDRFTERARMVMTLSLQEAVRLRCDYIGVEHILLGLVAEGSGVAVQVFKDLDVDLRKLRAEVELVAERGKEPVNAARLPFTPRAKRVLENALEESVNLGHDYIGTEHLLLGLLRESEGPSAKVLRALGVSSEAARRRVTALLGVEAPPPVEPAEPVRSGGSEPLPGNRTERLSLALSIARGEAERLCNDYLGTEHLLLGLVQAGDCSAVEILRDCGVPPGTVFEYVDRLVERGVQNSGKGPLPLTPRAKKALRLAEEEFVRSGRDRMGTEHLLLGLLLERDGPAAHVLQVHGLKLEDVRRSIAARRAAPGGREGDSGSSERRLTGAAVRAIVAAESVALGSGAAGVGPLPLLVGLLDAGPCGAVRVLERLGASPAAVAAEARRILGKGWADTPHREIPLDPEGKGVFVRALAARAEFGHDSLGTVHLLLGLAEYGGKDAGRILAKAGAGHEAILRALKEMGESGPE